jgi:hypothetical protein
MNEIEETIGQEIANEVQDEIGTEPISEKEVDDIIWSKAMDACTGDICHWHVIDKVHENLPYDNLNIISYGS